MATVQLFAWNTVEQAGRTPVAWTGAVATSMRAPNDGNYGTMNIANGVNDSNSIVGNDWRTAAGGAFPWAGLTPSSIQVDYFLKNNGPAYTFPVAAYLADSPQTFYIEIWNGDLSLAPGAGAYVTMATRTDANMLAALKAGNLVASIIGYNHGQAASVSETIDAMRLTVAYTGVPAGSGGMLWEG